MAKQNLLVADADPRSLRILEVALRKAGFAVTTASDGAEVLRKLQRTQLDALLCELSLPGDDGLSVCRSVRADPRLGALPVLLMNADREPATRAAALQAGADDFLPKPLLIKEVVARVRTLLAQREQDRNSQRGAPAALTGTVGDLGLVDLFTSLDNWQRSATVLCEGDGRSARVWVRDGQVIDAEVPPLNGEAAFFRLLNWDAGSFRVDFGPVDREARTDAGTQGLLMEGMRRIDEMARLADTLPLSTVLAVDFPRLLGHLAEMPDELNGVLRLFDGVRTVREVIAGSPIDDLSTMNAVQKLMGDGVLIRGEPAAPRQKPSLQQWLGSTPVPPGAHLVSDEDLPMADVLATPPDGQTAAADRTPAEPMPSEASGASAAEAAHVGARVTPIRPARSAGGEPPHDRSGVTSAEASPVGPAPAPKRAPRPVRPSPAPSSSVSRPSPASASSSPSSSASPSARPPPPSPLAAVPPASAHAAGSAASQRTEETTPARGGAGTMVRIGVGAGRILLFRYPPQRGTRRERLRREADEARQAIATGRPVRLTHVLELPPAAGAAGAAPEGSRRMSAVVGEVAKRFAPDLPLGPLVRPWTTPETTPDKEAAPVARSEPDAAPASAPARGPVARKESSQRIGAALVDALAAERLEGANEVPGARSPDAAPAPRAPLASGSAPRSRTRLTGAILGAAALAVVAAVVWFVRRQHEIRPSVTGTTVEAETNATASVVPGIPVVPAPPAADAQPSPPAPPTPAPARGPARPAALSSSGEFARAFSTGETLLKQGRYRSAIAEYRKAVVLRPDSVPALIALGDAFLEADQPRNAVKPLQQAAQLDSRSARAQLLLGTAFQALGRPREAVAAYKRYLELEPNGEFAGDVRAIVANLSH